ncbi:MAG: sigma-54-dependent Fis family transcriptional regulator [Flavobacterium sp.]|nr:MAG: sigma-54-dependent Fis family transcriptional regulator [Flavobacterium sp.]
MSPEKLRDLKNRFEIVGNSPLLNRGLEVAMKVAPTDMTVLILGESGVGKENFSKIVHHLSKRKHNGFIAINCGAIPEGTIDSELFGHEKGSFTSAHDTRKGYFETVDGGTIFLDEIGELPLETQSRLLRVLESGEFLKVGSSKVQKTDVRVVAATNKDLLELSQKGKFREDLYYRLSTVSVKIPALRERKEDIMFLFAKFASDVADKYRVPPLELTPEALAVLQNFPWPGNIRQLKNFVEQLSVLETERTLTAETVQRYLPDIPTSQIAYTGPTGNQDQQQGFGNQYERELLYKFLFDIRRDIADLKTAMFELAKTTNPAQAATTHSPAVNPQTRYLAAPTYNNPEPQIYHAQPNIVQPRYEEETYVLHDVEHINGNGHSEPETLSLQHKEKEMIQKALAKHNGKRKGAAQELGISERTLYRKIKEYNLEEA